MNDYNYTISDQQISIMRLQEQVDYWKKIAHDLYYMLERGDTREECSAMLEYEQAVKFYG